METALKGLCPRCGAKTLFASVARFAPSCRACGLDLSQFNVDDGPAAFLILIVGAIVIGLSVKLELSAEPPFWVHLLLWPALTLALTLSLLRVAKAALLVLEWSGRHAPSMAEDCRGQSSPDHRHEAREGRINPR